AKDHVGAGDSLLGRAGRVLDFMLHGRDFFREGFVSAGEMAQRIADRLGMPAGVGVALPALYEHWDGRGAPYGLQGEAIPLVGRIVGASMYFTVWHMFGGRDAARQVARNRSGAA